MQQADDLFVRFAPHAEVLEPALHWAGSGKLPGRHGARELSRICRISSSRLPAVIAGLQAAEEAGVVCKDAHGMWAVALPQEMAREVALLMRGARIYRNRVHADADEVEVVISRPAAPSQLVAEPGGNIEGLWGLEETAVMLGQMAASATQRLSIMTPFVDEDGADRIVSLFQAARPGVAKELVVRDGLPTALSSKASELRTLGVAVYDFRIPRPDKAENETFHAKVVRVDASECYAGRRI